MELFASVGLIVWGVALLVRAAKTPKPAAVKRVYPEDRRFLVRWDLTGEVIERREW